MPCITIRWWKGVSKETKLKLAKDITDLVAKAIDLPPDLIAGKKSRVPVWIIFEDIDPDENWTIGGEPGSTAYD